jgi:hypothetical protein
VLGPDSHPEDLELLRTGTAREELEAYYRRLENPPP